MAIRLDMNLILVKKNEMSMGILSRIISTLKVYNINRYLENNIDEKRKAFSMKWQIGNPKNTPL